MTRLSDALISLRSRLASLTAHEDVPRLSRLVIKHATGLDIAAQIAAPDTLIPPDHIVKIDDMAARLLAHEPLSRILGARDFYGLSFTLSPDTLDPRPETELIVDAALAFLKNRPDARILDLGTGTGCIPIAILTHAPGATALALDIAPGAVATAIQNAARHHVADRFAARVSDWAAALRPDDTFDLITSNPPYIPAGDIAGLEEKVRRFDPIRALNGGGSGLDPYPILFAAIQKHLAPTGLALIEMGAGQAEAIARLAAKSGLDVTARIVDDAGHTRVFGVVPTA